MSAPAWCFIFTAGLLAGGQVSDVLRPHPIDSKRYFESTTLLGVLDDGTYVQALVAVSNIGVGNGEGACRVLLARPHGSPSTWSKSVDAGAWSFQAKPVPALHMGPCRLSNTASGLQLDVGLEEVQLSLTLARTAKVTVPPGMPLAAADDSDMIYETEVLVPFAPAEVVLVQGDAAPQILHGFGYADHARSTALPKHLGRGAVRFRGFAPGCSTVLYARFAAGAPVGFVWREGEAQPRDLRGWQVNLPALDADAGTVQVRLQEPGGAVWRVQAQRRWFRNAPLEDYGLLGKMVGAWMGSVVNETFAAELNAGGACAKVPGVLELDHNS